MPSLTASFVDVLDQSVNFTHLCARHYVVNVLVPALAKLAAQLVADLLIAAGLVGEPLRVGSVYFFVHMLTPSTSLILKHVVGSASGAQRNDWQSRSSSSTRGCVRSLALRGRAARAVCARTRQSMLTLAVHAVPEDLVVAVPHARATTALPCGRVVTLFLRGPR